MNTSHTSCVRTRRVGRGGTFLCLQLAGQDYAIEVQQVCEILGVVPVTALPRTPDHVLGVVNRRGRIVPVIDLRRRFDLEPVPASDASCIVVVEFEDGSGATSRVGWLVDTVGELIAIGDDDIGAAPRGGDAAGDCVAGLANVEGRLLILLDVARVGLDLVATAASEEPTP